MKFFCSTLFVLLLSFNSSRADTLELLFIGPLTGDVAPLGLSALKGLELYQKEFASNDVHLTVEDDQFKPINAVTAYQHSKLGRKPNIVLVAGSQSALAIAPLVSKDHIALIAIASDGAVSANNPYAVNLWVTPKEEAKAIVAEMDRRAYKSIAMVAVEHPGASAIEQAITSELQNQQILLSSNQTIALDASDCRSVALKLKKDPSVGGIVLILFPGQLSTCAVQIRNLGIQQQFIGAETMESPDDVKIAGNALIGAWYAQAPVPSNEFLARLTAAFGEIPTVSSAAAYDGMSLAIEAYKNTSHDGKSIGAYLRTIKNFAGIQGTFSSTGDGTYSIPASIKVITKNGFEVLPSKQ